ncbi:MAG: chemotaxis protein CheX [Planctomycetaceae bacterium]|nr:chemotaxis protein CheX [Planctomycetaceae bacterium]
MSTRTFDEALAGVAADTVESLAMMFLLSPEEASLQGPATGSRAAAVAFTGPFGGSVIVETCGAVQSQLAANMLGLESDAVPTEQQEQDALKELVNVICGNLLPVLAGPTPVFHIDAPRLLTPQQALDARRDGLAAVAAVCTEAGEVNVVLLTDAPMPETVEA